MAEDSIDRLAIEISGDSNAAVKSLNQLTKWLSSFETRLSTAVPKVMSLTYSLSQLNSRLNAFNPSGLKGLNDIKFSSTVPKNIGQLADVINRMPDDAVSRLMNISTALSGLSGVKITKSTVDNLARIPAALKEYESLDIDAFISKIAELNPRIKELATNVTHLATAYKALPKSMQTAGLAARSVAAANKYLAQTEDEASVKTDKLKTKVSSLGTTLKTAFNIAGIMSAWYMIKRVFEATIGEVNQYIEDMNLFNASMGQYADEAEAYAQKVSSALGIDAGEWSKYQGVFQNLATSFGITGDRAAVMSQNLTQLAYDLSSFHNMSVDDAALKLQSGLAGEIEPMRRIGVDLSNAAMQVEATSLGITKLVSDMTQAEKAALRYRLALKGTTIAQGDMARTLASPANQLRVLQAQLKMAARAIGNLFIPALNMILPVVIGVVKAITLLAQTIAAFFGIDATFEVDYGSLDGATATSGIDGVTDAFDDSGDAADKAKKKVQEYKNTVMGFDELNKLNDVPEADSGSSGSGGVGGVDGSSVLADIPLDTYDFLANLTDDITRRTDAIAAKVQELLPHIAAVAAGFAAWRIAGGLGASLIQCVGWALALVGAVELVTGAFDAWNNGLDLSNFTQMLLGATALVVGLGLALKSTGAGWGLIIAGVVVFGVSLHDVITNGLNEINTLGMILGATALTVGVMLVAGITSPLVGIIGLLAGAAICVVGFMDAWNSGVSIINLEAILGGIAVACLGVGAAFGPVAAAVVAVVGCIGLLVVSIKDMFENGFSPENFAATEIGFVGIGTAIGALVGGPIGALIGALIGGVVGAITTMIIDFDGFAAWLDELWNGIVEGTRFIWEPVADWFNTNVIEPVGTFFADLGQGIQDIWTGICEWFAGVGQWFSDLWNTVVQGIQDIWNGVADWMNTYVIQPIVSFWSPIVSWFAKLFGSVCQTVYDIWYDICVIITGVWTIICRVWEVASTWFYQTVLVPVGTFFSSVWTAITNVASGAWTNIKSVWSTVTNWFNTNIIQPLGKTFTNVWNTVTTLASNAWNGIKNVFSNFASFFGTIVSNAWQKVKNVFQTGGQIFEGIKDAIINAFKKVVNNLISGINWAIAQPFNGLNWVIGEIRNFEVLGVRPFSGLSNISVPTIPYLAEGRYGIPAGQLFVARERGPEMVGEMGSHTTVANNQQIVQGIEQGVEAGVIRAMALFNASSSDGGETTIEIPVVLGVEEISRAVWKGQASLVRRGVIKPQYV